MNPLALKSTDLDVTLLPSAITARDQAVSAAQQITAVSDELDQHDCAEALKSLKALAKSVEQSRQAVKAPVLDLERKIDGIAKEFGAPLANEIARLDGMLTSYITEQRRLAREAEERRLAEERRRREEQERAEAARRKAEEDAARAAEEARRKAEQEFLAENKAEQEKARHAAAEAQRRAQEEAVRAERARRESAQAEASRLASTAIVRKPFLPKLAGVGVSEPWTFRVIDLVELYKARPELVELTVRAAAVNIAIRNGLRDCPGLEIFQQTKINVRA